MAFVLLIVGAFLLVSSIKGTQGDLARLFKGEFISQSGQANFIYWMTAIFIIGAVGYLPKLKGLSTMFLGLVVVVLFLKKGDPKGIGGGFFSQFTQALGAKATTATAPATTAAAPASPTALPNVLGFPFLTGAIQ